MNKFNWKPVQTIEQVKVKDSGELVFYNSRRGLLFIQDKRGELRFKCSSKAEGETITNMYLAAHNKVLE